MNKYTLKILSSLLTIAILIGLIVPPVKPAMAGTENRMHRFPTVGTEFEGLLNSVSFKEEAEDHFASGDTFLVTLPKGVEFAYQDGANWKSVTNDVYAARNHQNNLTTLTTSPGSIEAGSWLEGPVDVTRTKFTNERTLEVVLGSTDDNKEEIINLNLYVMVDDAIGDIKLEIDSHDSGITGGEMVVGRVDSGTATVEAMSVENIADTNNETGGLIEITEISAGALVPGETIKLKLNSGFKWKGSTSVNVSAGAQGKLTAASTVVSDRELQIKLGGTKTQSRGIIYITPKISVYSDASYGDVEVDVSGADIDSTTVVIGKYSDYGVNIEAGKEIPTLYYGTIDNELAEFYIEETVKGSLVEGRKITFELPETAKFNKDPEIKLVSGSSGVLPSIFTVDTDDRHRAEIIVTGTSTEPAKYKITCKSVNIKSWTMGDLTMKVDGSAIDQEKSVVLAKTLPPYDFRASMKVTDSTNKMLIGKQEQEGNEIIIKETVKGAIKKDSEVLLPGIKSIRNVLYLNIQDSDGEVKFSEEPKVEVIEGDLELGEPSLVPEPFTTDDKQVWVAIDVKGESTKPSTIKISNLKFDIDRTAISTPVDVRLKGVPVAQSYDPSEKARGKSSSGWNIPGATIGITGNIITPAPALGTASFNIGSTIYKAHGIMKVMDAAPYIKEGRTYVPLRYMAQALGVSEENIKYENNTVTLETDSVTLKFTIGDKNMEKNGDATAMDVAPEINNGRTMLPARFVAEGLGAQVGYGPGQVTVTFN